MTYVTTALDLTNKTFAENLAIKYNWQYIERSKINNISEIADKLIVVEKNKLSLRLGKESMFFHPGLSILRINNLLKGDKDRFVEACLLEKGNSFLDATLGMASDSIVAAFVTGEQGKVVGLEAVPEVAIITEYGLKNFLFESTLIAEAAKRIQVIKITACQYLQESDSLYDCVYFDPMFRKPNLASSGINMLRPFALKNELTKTEIQLALGRARKCVVVKEMSLQKLKELDPDEILGGKNARLFYARWNK